MLYQRPQVFFLFHNKGRTIFIFLHVIKLNRQKYADILDFLTHFSYEGRNFSRRPNSNMVSGITPYFLYIHYVTGQMKIKNFHYSRACFHHQPCVLDVAVLTNWGRVTHICVGKLIIIGSDNGLSPGRRQAIIWTNAGIWSMGPLGTNYSEILIEILIQ